jgi:hypothetical protein
LPRFKNLGGSWKRQRSRTLRLNRLVHGQEGRGRFKAFALGDVVDWKVVYEKDGTPFRYDITMLEHEIGRVRVSDEEPLLGEPTGVIVAVSEIKKQFSSLKPENSIQELSEIFAFYLKDYRDVQITIGSERIEMQRRLPGRRFAEI